MRKSLFVLTIITILYLAGCIPFSVNPIYSENDIIYKPDLIGTWSEKDSDEKYIFTDINGRYYSLVIKNEGVIEGIFIAQLVKLGQTMFLDLTPKFGTPYGDGFYNDHFVILHSFFRVHQIDSTLTISMLNYGWLEKYLEQNPDEISFDKINGQIMLTAPTKDIQSFLLKHLDTKDAYDEPGSLQRE